MRDLETLEQETRVVLNSMLQGWGSPWIMDNIKIELDEDEDDFYDSSFVVRKRVNGVWSMVGNFYFQLYNEDGFMVVDRMMDDIVDCVKLHYETPKKKSLDGCELNSEYNNKKF